MYLRTTRRRVGRPRGRRVAARAAIGRRRHAVRGPAPARRQAFRPERWATATYEIIIPRTVTALHLLPTRRRRCQSTIREAADQQRLRTILLNNYRLRANTAVPNNFWSHPSTGGGHRRRS